MEYFDKGLANILEKVAEVKTEMVTKADLKIQLDDQTKKLQDYTNQAFEVQQTYMDERFKELIVQYDVRERVEKLEKEFREFRLGKPAHA